MSEQRNLFGATSVPPTAPAGSAWAHGVLHEGIEEEAYNAAEGIRSSEVKDACRSAAHWRAGRLQPRKDTPALAMGRLIHCAILEPEKFRTTVFERPSVGDLRGIKAKAELDAWRSTLPAGATDVSGDDMQVVRGILDAARSHSRLPNLLKTGKREVSLFWHDDACGLDQKMRADFISDAGFVVDVKTCADASPAAFARDIIKWSYNLSASHYTEGARVTGAANPDHFIIVAVEKTPPYGIGLYVLDGDMLDIGHQWRHHGLATIAQALRTGEYPGYPEDFRVLECPKWAPRPVGFEG